MELIKMAKEDITKEVCSIFCNLLAEKPNANLGLATGSTPVAVYRSLIETFKQGKISFKKAKTFNLDEYIGLDESHEQSYRYFMNENLFSGIDIDISNTHVPLGKGDIDKNAADYDRLIDLAGGIDLQLLGIGSNGHIAFNEPGTPFSSFTHIVDLTEQTRKDNARFFSSLEDVPHGAITMGLASIMKAKKIVLIALGENKAEALRRLIEENETTDLPASILKSHPDCLVFADELAASKLTK